MERSKQLSKSSASDLYITETARLQKDLELMTLKLEQERRQSSFLDEQIEVYEFEIKDSVKAPSKLDREVEALKKKLNLEHSKLNNFKSHNQYLRIKIDVSRKELQQGKKVIKDLTGQIQNYVKKSEKKHSSIERCQMVDQRQKDGILMLRSQSADARRKHSRYISNLNSYIKDELESKNIAIREMEKVFTDNVNKQSGAVHVSWYLKSTLKWWNAKLKEAKTSLDNYTRYVKQLKESFRQIELATGIDDVFDVVTSFVKGDA